MGYTQSMKRAGELAARSLSDKAAAFYSSSDPLALYEYNTIAGLRYAVTGIVDAAGLTLAEVDALFSEYHDKTQED